jgi:Beta-propeller repeat/Abnormal spindle-like microcephaly-assoc'd, ASPM-SPD-2-Hydin
VIHKKLSRLLFLLSIIASIFSAQQLVAGLDQPSMGHLSLAFEPNAGQAPADVAFVVRGPYPVFLKPDRATLIVPNVMPKKGSGKPASTVSIQLVGSNVASQSEGLQQLPGKSNYYIGADARNWKSGIPQYAAVNFKSVYPGIDLLYYGKDGQLEYDLVLSPGADPSSIKFEISGAGIELNKSGNLALHVSQGIIELRRPVIYQKHEDGSRQTVSGDFVVHGNEVTLRIGNYEKDKQLIVDPVLSFSTLIGANNSTSVAGVAVDESGDMFITGTTFATNYPTVNAFQSKNNGTTNVFVTKLNPAGDVILYSTYIGGGAFDNAAGIAVDASGSAYITGTATSGNFPTTPGAFMTSCGEFCNTPFVSKFLSDGSIGFSTYMGGSNSPAHAIAVDNAGEAYIAGDTASNDLPTTPGSFEPIYPGGQCTSCYNGYVEKLNSTGTALVYSTYFGAVPTIGTPSTIGSGIAVDAAGSAYLVGSTTAIPTQNPIQASYVTGSFLPSAYVTKFSPDGSALEYSTYLGGSSPFFTGENGDYATSVAVDSSGNAHVAGTSSSCDFPLSLNAMSTTCVNTEYDQKIFALVLNSTGSQLLFSTFLSSGNTPSIAVDSKGDSYVAGTTTSYQFPVLNPIESTSQQAMSTTFVTELALTGKLKFSTYFGATYGATSNGLAVDSKGGIYIAGEGQNDFPLLNPIPSQILQSTDSMIFASKIDPNQAPQFSLAPRVSPILAFRNVSSAALTIDSIVPSSNFTMGGNCGTSLAPATQCTLILEGADDHKTSGTVTITTNANSKPETFKISKSANGDGNVGPLVTAFPTTLQFPTQFIGSTSPAQNITLQNTGTGIAQITGITLGQPFNQTNNCPAALNPSSSCTISVTYTAATSNDYNAVSISLNQLLPLNVNVNGYGVSSSLALSTTSVQFGNQTVGVAGVARIVNVQNASSAPTTAPAISISSGFTQTNTCKSVLAPGAGCRVAVNFLPSGNQNATGTLTVNGYGPGGPQTVSLFATGLAAGALELSPETLSFYGYLGGTQIQQVTVTNTSTGTVPINSVQSPAPFSQTNDCVPILGPAASCQVTITWDPTQAGSWNGLLQVSYTGTGSPQTIALSGTALNFVQFAPSIVQFAPQVVNTASTEMTTFVENNENVTVTLGPVSIQGSAFSIPYNGCGSQLAGNTGCMVGVIFTPTTLGAQTGSLSVTASDSSTPHTATLQGTGVSIGTENVSPLSATFGTQTVGTRSSPHNVTVSNVGTGPLGITSIAMSESFFIQQNNCGSSLAAGASCTIAVRFSPNREGMLIGTLTVQTDGSNSPQTVTLSGTGQ